MSVTFRMPALGPDMTEGTVVEWRVAPGDTVHRGDVVLLVETAKGIIDVEVFHDGTVEQLLVEPGTQVPVDAPLAVFSGEPVPAAPAASAALPSPAQPASPTTPASAPAPAAAAATPRARISPAARARATAAGLAVDAIGGSGPDGAITLADVERAVAAAGGAAHPADAAPSAMRQAIAAAMSRAKRDIPHYYLAHSLDFSAANDWLRRFNATRPVEERMLYAVLLIKAVARAAGEIPGFAGLYRNGRFRPAPDIHVGFAIAQRGGGLIAPGLMHAATRDLPALMQDLKDLIGRTRGGHLRSSELELPVITVTSLGDEGVDAAFPIIFPDQVAIVAAGRIAERPWVVDGQVLVRPVLTLTLAADHRVTDGRAGGRFLARIAALLGAPERL